MKQSSQNNAIGSVYSSAQRPDLFALGWHAGWVPEFARHRALAALLEMHGTADGTKRDARGLLPWERIGLALAADVHAAMDGIESAEFIERAQLTALTIYLRHLDHLLRTSLRGGSA